MRHCALSAARRQCRGSGRRERDAARPRAAVTLVWARPRDGAHRMALTFNRDNGQPCSRACERQGAHAEPEARARPARARARPAPDLARVGVHCTVRPWGAARIPHTRETHKLKNAKRTGPRAGALGYTLRDDTERLSLSRPREGASDAPDTCARATRLRSSCAIIPHPTSITVNCHSTYHTDQLRTASNTRTKYFPTRKCARFIKHARDSGARR